jgi:hypothetical protein
MLAVNADTFILLEDCGFSFQDQNSRKNAIIHPDAARKSRLRKRREKVVVIL